jgi:3-hydroxyisobutyrate dehydrogenase-like beta-hydroxyacid dehydrogenase
MGRPMVSRLLAAGHTVTVHARRDAVRASLADEGALVVDTPAAACLDSDVIVLCLFSDDQLREVFVGPDGVLAAVAAGTVIASHVTGRRSTIVEFDRLARERGAHVVDAPVSGGVPEIESGRLTVMLGGDDAAVEAAQSVLAAYASPIVRTGALGSALAVKLINNLLFTVNGQAVASALELAAEFGVDPASLFTVLSTASGNSFAASSMSNRGSAAEWMNVVGEFLRKDVAACEEELTDSGSSNRFLLDIARGGPLDLI